MGNQPVLCTGAPTCCADSHGPTGVTEQRSKQVEVYSVHCAEYIDQAASSTDASAASLKPALSLRTFDSNRPQRLFEDRVKQNLNDIFARCHEAQEFWEESVEDSPMVLRLGLGRSEVEASSHQPSHSSSFPPRADHLPATKQDEKCSHGVYTWPDGRRYEGQFCAGNLQGQAVMSWPDGRVYVGQYLQNKKHGAGVFTWPDGRQYSGDWSAGERHGSGLYRNAKGETSIGRWVKDRPVSWGSGSAAKGGA